MQCPIAPAFECPGEPGNTQAYDHAEFLDTNGIVQVVFDERLDAAQLPVSQPAA
jgi:hypothetical protein